MADFMPKNDAKRLTWLTGLKTEYPKHVAELEITPERAATVDAWIDAHIAAIQNVSQKRAEWLAATAAMGCSAAATRLTRSGHLHPALARTSNSPMPKQP